MDVTHNDHFTNKKLLYILVGVSLFFHVVISFYTVSTNVFNTSFTKNEEQKIRIKLLTPKKDKIKQIARTEKSKLSEVKKAKFLSAQNNSFDRETKTALNGQFQTVAKGSRNARSHKSTDTAKNQKAKSKKLSFSALAMQMNEKVQLKKNKKIAREMQTKKGLKSGKIKGKGLGKTNDFLEDIPLGDFTKLNTQEYEFYGFYNRIKEKLEQFWGLNIQEKAQKIYKSGRSLASDRNLITGLTIAINSKGEIVDIMVKSPSGIKELDDAAIESFNRAGPFPNPPKGMIRNGKAIIEWGFVVNT